MKILVTGGAGFIGSEVVRQLVAGGEEDVTVVDALTYAGDLARLASVEGKYRFVRGDVADIDLKDHEEIPLGPFDVVIHLAAETHVDRSIVSWETAYQTNVTGTILMLERAVAWKSKRFVHVSTDEVYGEAPEERGSFEDDPMRPQSPYAASKAAADCAAQAWAHTTGLEVVVTRGSNTYGPWQHPEKMVPTSIAALMDGRPVPIYGDGQNQRDWIHVRDHASGIVEVATRGMGSNPAFLNIGSGVRTKNMDLVVAIAGAMGKRAMEWTAKFVPDRPGHVRRHAVECGWSPITLSKWRKPSPLRQDFLEETIRWYAENEGWWRGKLESEDHRRHLASRDDAFLSSLGSREEANRG